LAEVDEPDGKVGTFHFEFLKYKFLFLKEKAL